MNRGCKIGAFAGECRQVLGVLGMFFALVLGGCGGSEPAPIETEFQPFTDSEREIRNQTVSASYRFRVGDLFSVDFKYEDELDQQYVLVLPDGHCTIAGAEAGSLPAAGMTVTQLDSIITNEFAKDYIRPDLSIVVNEIAKLQVYVIGEVMDPGLHNMPEGTMGVMQAIAAASGFTDNARRSEVLVARVTPDGFLYRRIDMNSYRGIGLQSIEYLDIQPYDVVYVPRSSLGDLQYFGETVLVNAVRVANLFWSAFAIQNMSQAGAYFR